MTTTLETKLWLGACAGSLLVGAYSGHKAFPNVQIHETVKTQTEVKDHVVVQTRTIYRKDGTKEVDSVKTSDKDVETRRNSDSVNSKPAINSRPNWHLVGGIGVDISLQRFYSLSVERRIVGPIFVGVQADTRQTIGVNVGIEF